MEWKGYDDDTFGLGYKDLIQTNVSRNSSKIGEQADAEEYHNLGDDVEVSRFAWYLICTSIDQEQYFWNGTSPFQTCPNKCGHVGAH